MANFSNRRIGVASTAPEAATASNFAAAYDAQPQQATSRGLSGATNAEPQNTDSAGLICDGQIHTITLPLPPIAEIPPYSTYNLAGTGLGCSRRQPGSQCGAQEHVDCAPWGSNIGPVTLSAGTTFFLPPSDPIILTVENSTQFLTFTRWTVFDVGTGGAKLVGVYENSTISLPTAPVVVAHEWQPNGRISNTQGSNSSYFCGACTNCELGKGVKVCWVGLVQAILQLPPEPNCHRDERTAAMHPWNLKLCQDI